MSNLLNKKYVISIAVIITVLFCFFCPKYLNTFISAKDSVFIGSNINKMYSKVVTFILFGSMIFFFIFFRYIKGKNSDAKRILLSVSFSLLLIIFYGKVYDICNLWEIKYYKIYSTVIKDKKVSTSQGKSGSNSHYFFAYSLNNNENDLEWIELHMFNKNKIWKKLNRGNKISIYYYKGSFSDVEQIVFE